METLTGYRPRELVVTSGRQCWAAANNPAFGPSTTTDADLRRLVNAMTNKTGSFNDFAKWAYFAEDTFQENVRDEQVKTIKYNHLIANLLIFHNVYSMTCILNELEAKGIAITPEMLCALSPYRTGHINRFGIYEVRDREVGEINYALQILAAMELQAAQA